MRACIMDLCMHACMHASSLYILDIRHVSVCIHIHSLWVCMHAFVHVHLYIYICVCKYLLYMFIYVFYLCVCIDLTYIRNCIRSRVPVFFFKGLAKVGL